jgi:L-threonylcarbamoyladenylate synthase
MLEIETGQEEFTPEQVEACADILRSGGLCIIPTDTVYGIAASASDAAAVERLLALKDRAPDKPLPVQVASSNDANVLGVADSPLAVALIERFWPGPLTIVMERRPGVDLPFQKPGTIGIRVPASRFCIALMKRAGNLVVPSANPPGAPAPVSVGEVAAEIMSAVDLVVDAGACPGGIESTVVDITAGAVVLREGALSATDVVEAIEAGGST